MLNCIFNVHQSLRKFLSVLFLYFLNLTHAGTVFIIQPLFNYSISFNYIMRVMLLSGLRFNYKAVRILSYFFISCNVFEFCSVRQFLYLSTYLWHRINQFFCKKSQCLVVLNGFRILVVPQSQTVFYNFTFPSWRCSKVKNKRIHYTMMYLT